MHKRLLPLFAFLLCLGAGAQRKYSSDKFRSYSIELPVPSAENSGQFGNIAVVDKRFDTSKAGFISDGSKHRILSLKEGVAGSVQHYLSKRYTENKAALPQLLFVLRNLWLHELKAGELKEGEEGMDKQTISRCIVKIEAYLVKDDACMALLRVDTTAEEQGNLRFSGGRMLAGVLDEGMKKIMALDLERATAKKTKMSMPELMKLYDQRSVKPRLISDTMQRGVYLTFADFLEKRPKLYDFVLEQDDAGDFLYLNENGSQRLFTDFWGFSDGKFHFIKLGNSFFPLVRDGNAYSFFGCLQPIHNSGPRSRNRVARYALFGVFGELHNNRLLNYLRPMQVDMETGKVF